MLFSEKDMPLFYHNKKCWKYREDRSGGKSGMELLDCATVEEVASFLQFYEDESILLGYGEATKPDLSIHDFIQMRKRTGVADAEINKQIRHLYKPKYIADHEKKYNTKIV